MVQHAQVLLGKLGAMPTQTMTPLVRLVRRRVLELKATLVRTARGAATSPCDGDEAASAAAAGEGKHSRRSLPKKCS